MALARLVAVAAVTLAGCGEPRVDVGFDVPAPWTERVTSASLTVYAPADPRAATCDDIALGLVTEPALTAARVLEVVTAPGEPVDLDGIPRTGGKRFVARGYDDGLRPLVAGCVEVDTVDGATTIDIPGEPALQLAVPGLRTTLDEVPAAVEILASDADGNPAPGVAVRWGLRTLDGPGPIAEVVTGERGRARVELPPASTPGPIGIDATARWQANPLPAAAAFAPPAIVDRLTFTADAVLTDNDALYQVGAVGPAGEPGYAVLAPVSVAGAWAIHVRYRRADGTWRGASAPSVATRALGLVPRTSGDATRDAIVTVVGGDWVEIDPDSGAVVELGRPGGGVLASRIVAVGGCVDDAPPVLLVTRGDGSTGTYGADLAAVAAPAWTAAIAAGDRVLASGCAADVAGAVHRAVVIERSDRVVVVSDIDGGRTGLWPVAPRGVGFTRAAPGALPHLVGTEVTIDGTQLTRVELVSLGAALSFAPVASDPIASAAVAVAGGHLNDDVASGFADAPQPDLVALVFTGAGRGGVSTVRPFVAVSQDAAYGSLRGLWCEQALVDPRVFLLDVDGDGRDEVIVGALGEALVVDLSQLGAGCPAAAP
jgi:hypothetical protein